MNLVITGASSGIGYEVAKRFAEKEGNLVFALARSAGKLTELSNYQTSSKIIPVVTDLATYDFSQLSAAIKPSCLTHIDYVIHNAGMLINKPFEEIKAEEWEEIYRVNVIGAGQLTRHLLPYLGGEKPSHIVTIGSMGGVRGSLKFPGLSAYSSSKGALGTLTECLAEEFKGRNIHVNCLALGSVQTEMLTKAFPGYVASMSAAEVSRFIYDFTTAGWRQFNGKILEVSTSNP